MLWIFFQERRCAGWLARGWNPRLASWHRRPGKYSPSFTGIPRQHPTAEERPSQKLAELMTARKSAEKNIGFFFHFNVCIFFYRTSIVFKPRAQIGKIICVCDCTLCHNYLYYYDYYILEP